MTTPEGPYLLLDTFNDYQDTIDAELRLVHEETRELHEEIGEFRHEVRENFDDLRQDFHDLRREVRQIAAEQTRSTAWLRNQLLSNPTLPIQPIVIFDETRGVVQPDMNLFPRHAKEFYTLRDPQTERQRAKLEYMVSFYDVTLPETTGPSSSSASSPDDGSSDDGSDDDSFNDRNALAVHMLEGILGLSEDRFITFTERARERAARVAAPLTKRAQDKPPSEAPPATRPFVRLELGDFAAQEVRPAFVPPLTLSQLIKGSSAYNKSTSSDSQAHSNAKLIWLPGSPSAFEPITEGAEGGGSSHSGESQRRLSSRPKNAEIQEEHKDIPSEPGDSGSPTNPFSRTPSLTRFH